MQAQVQTAAATARVVEQQQHSRTSPAGLKDQDGLAGVVKRLVLKLPLRPPAHRVPATLVEDLFCPTATRVRVMVPWPEGIAASVAIPYDVYMWTSIMKQKRYIQYVQ